MSDSGVGRRRWLIAPLGAVLAWLEWVSSTDAVGTVLLADVAAGLALLAGAIVQLATLRGRRIGILWAAAGVAWFAGALVPLLAGLYLGPLCHVIAAYPGGGLRRTAATIVVAVGYAAALAAPLVAVDLRAPAMAAAATVAAIGAAGSKGAPRRGRWSAAIAGMSIALCAGLTSFGASQGWIGRDVAQILYSLVVGGVAIALAVDLRWGGWSQDALTRLVIDLGDRTEPSTLRGRLADALDDPTLVVAYRVTDGPGHVDETGRPVATPVAGSGRVAVPLRAGGTEVGVLVRDERQEMDPLLTAGVAQAAELALANVRLNTATRQQLDALDASRIRLIEATESERTRIRLDLDAGALRRLVSVERRLVRGPDDEAVRSILTQVRGVIAQLDELARGLGASTPLEAGLAAALHGLAERLPVPVTVEVPPGRWPPIVESTAYFVASEALANVAKHARATHAWLRVDEVRGQLRLDVADDGIGGAVPSSGSGLEGLTQRVEATGGRLRIGDRDGGGTRLTAELPIDRAAGPDGGLAPSPA